MKYKYLPFFAFLLFFFTDGDYISTAQAAKKADAIYTGPPLVFKKPSAWYMNEFERCFGSKFNRRKFENKVAEHSWEDFKNLKAGKATNTRCYNRKKCTI